MLNEILQELKKRHYNVSTQNHKTNNTSYTELIIKDMRFPLSFHLNISDTLFAYAGQPMEKILDYIINTYEQHKEINKTIDKKFILENIHIAIQNTSDDTFVKKTTKFTNIEKYLCITGLLPNKTIVHLGITTQFLKDYNISQKEAWIQAEENNQKDDTILENKTLEKNTELEKLKPFYIITNKTKNYGGAAILNEELLEQFKKEHNDTNWQIIFSSIHYNILMPIYEETETNKIMIDFFNHMNNNDVLSQDRLISEPYQI